MIADPTAALAALTGQAFGEVDLGGFLVEPAQAPEILGAALPALRQARCRAKAIRAVRAACRAAQAGAETLDPHAEALLDAWRVLQVSVLAASSTGDPLWRWREGYRSIRRTAAALADVLGHLSPSIAEGPLQATAVWPDPLLRLHAGVGLARLERGFPAGAVEPILRDLETRVWGFECLLAAGRADLLSPRWCTGPALAASAVAAVCTAPALLGVAPVAVEFVDAAPMGGRGADWCYVLRLRVAAPHPLARAGWLAALAGSVAAPPDEEAVVPAWVATRLEPFDSCSWDTHLTALADARYEVPIAPPCR